MPVHVVIILKHFNILSGLLLNQEARDDACYLFIKIPDIP